MKAARILGSSPLTLKCAISNHPSVLPLKDVQNASQSKICHSRALATLSAASPFLYHTPSIPRLLLPRKPCLRNSRRSCALEVPNINDDLVNAPLDLKDFKEFLKSKNIDYRENHACLVVDVPKYLFMKSEETCEEAQNVPWKEVDESIVKVHLNKTTKAFVCPQMAVTGNVQLLKEFLTIWSHNRMLEKDKLTEKKALPVLELKNIFPDSVDGLAEWTRARPIESLTESEFKDVLKLLQLPKREFTLNGFASLQATINCDFASDGKTLKSAELFFPVRYIDGQVMAIRKIHFNHKSRSIQEETLRSRRINHIMPFPHGLDKAYKYQSRKVVLVSSILDSIALTSRMSSFNSELYGICVIALGEGVLSLPPDQLPFFDDEQIDLLTFWFPNTTESMESIRSFSKKLGESRCQMIPMEHPQPWLWFKTNKATNVTNVAHFIETSSKECGHKYVTTFDRLRHDVYLELLHHEEVKGTQWKRFEKLNELLRGFRRGELTIFSGRTGLGKTTFMSEYSLDLCSQNIKTLWGSFEVKNTRLVKMQMKQYSGINLEENLEEFDKWASKFQKLPFYYLTFHGAQEVILVVFFFKGISSTTISIAVRQSPGCHGTCRLPLRHFPRHYR